MPLKKIFAFIPGLKSEVFPLIFDKNLPLGIDERIVLWYTRLEDIKDEQEEDSEPAAGTSTMTTKYITDTSKVYRKITGFSSGKTCYVRMRAYKKVSGTTYYSAWSDTVKVKTK